MFDFVSIPAIVVICWFIGMCVKSLSTSKKLDKVIPCICGLAGGVLAVIVFFTTPSLMPVDDIVSAIATGIVSGLAATGVHEAFTQLKK